MWNIPKIWQDGECYIIGGGPSIIEQFNITQEIVDKVRSKELSLDSFSPYLKSIHNKHIIGVNMSYQLGNWVDMVFFGDMCFYRGNKNELLQFPGMKITCRHDFKSGKYKSQKIRYIQKDGNKPDGITIKKNKVSWNLNSGAAAINLAVQLGVKKIILLGFDMDITNKWQHWHDAYNRGVITNMDSLPFERHLRCFPAIKNDLDGLGIEIINCSPNSVINSFKKKNINEIL